MLGASIFVDGAVIFLSTMLAILRSIPEGLDDEKLVTIAISSCSSG